MTKYLGPLKNKKQAMRWADILMMSEIAELRDAGKYLRINWESVAARPELANEFLNAVNGELE